MQGLFNEVRSAAWPVYLPDGSLQELGRFTVSGILKHESNCFPQPGRA